MQPPLWAGDGEDGESEPAPGLGISDLELCAHHQMDVLALARSFCGTPVVLYVGPGEGNGVCLILVFRGRMITSFVLNVVQFPSAVRTLQIREIAELGGSSDLARCSCKRKIGKEGCSLSP